MPASKFVYGPFLLGRCSEWNILQRSICKDNRVCYDIIPTLGFEGCKFGRISYMLRILSEAGNRFTILDSEVINPIFNSDCLGSPIKPDRSSSGLDLYLFVQEIKEPSKTNKPS